MKNKIFKRNERTLEILEAVAKIGFIMFLGVAAPNAAGHIIKLLGWVPDYKNKYATQKTLQSLEKRKFIRFWVKDGKEKLELTKEGRLYFVNIKVKSIRLPMGIKWDGLWRVVTFDIPEKLKANRRRFSRTLDFAGMYNIEKSIFVYPHECKKHIFEIADLYEVRKYIRFMVVNSIEPDFELKRVFPYIRSYK